jgi:transcriptional regulator with XRE-family HTH domain
MTLTKLFSDVLKHYREAVGLSQEDLAAKAGLDRTYISQLERGLKSPTLTSIEKIGECLGIEPEMFLRAPRVNSGPRMPDDYVCKKIERVAVSRGRARIAVASLPLTSAINSAHEMIDDMYGVDLDIAATLGMRNLSSFIGELVAAAILKTADGLFQKNPHQDGYPDLLLLDGVGRKEWEKLNNRMRDKRPFSPFAGGGIEVKATCGSVPSPAVCVRRNMHKPGIGDSRIECMAGYDWKAHHRETNNLLGVFWDFISGRPRVVALFYSNKLTEDDWGKIVHPREGGGRTTSVSIMTRSGIRKMYDGWLCVLKTGGYAEFLNHRNDGDKIPVAASGNNQPDAAGGSASPR